MITTRFPPSELSLKNSYGSFNEENPTASISLALRALKPETLSRASIKDRIVVKDSSETIVHLLSKKPRVNSTSLLTKSYLTFEDLELLMPGSVTLLTDPYLTFEDLQFFKFLEKKGMQSKYVSLLNELRKPLTDKELVLFLKQILLVLFFKIDPNVANDFGELLPALIAKHLNNPRTSADNRKLLDSVYTKYLLVSET